MTDDLRKLAQEHSGRADDAGRLARLLAQQLDTIDRLTAELGDLPEVQREMLSEIKRLTAKNAAQRGLLELAHADLTWVGQQSATAKAISQHLQPKEGA